MTGRNPDGAEDFPSEVAYGPQRLDTIIGAYEDFRDRVRGTDDLRFHFVLELPGTETVRAENPIRWREQHSCGVGGPAVVITDHVPVVRFPPEMRVMWLCLSQCEET